MEGLEERHIDVSRGLHYRYYTTANNTPVTPSTPALFILHGFPDGAQLWQFVVPHLLPTKLKIIVPDLLGYGGTSKPTDHNAFEIGAMAQDFLELLKNEGLPSDNTVVPIGHDWGSYAAQRFYMLHPDICAGLVNLSVSLMAPVKQEFDLDAMNAATEKANGYPAWAYWNLFLPHEGAELIDSGMDSFWHVLHGVDPDWMKQMFCVPDAMKNYIEHDRRDRELKPHGKDARLREQWMAAHDPKRGGSGMLSPTNWYRALAWNVNLATEKKLSPQVDKPYLFIGSTWDAVCRIDAIEMAKKEGWCKDLSVKVIESGHWIPYEKPDEIGEALLEWLVGKRFLKGSGKL